MLLQLAHHLAPKLPQEPLQEVFHGAEHTRGVMSLAMQLLINFSSFSLVHTQSKGAMLCCLCVIYQCNLFVTSANPSLIL